MASDQTDKHLNLLAEVTLCNDAYDKIVNDVPNTAGEQHTTMVTAMLDTGASMCIVSRCMTMQMEVSRNKLETTTKRLVEANGAQIELDGAVFLNLTVGYARSSKRCR